MHNEQHQMELELTYPTGAEKWRCPACECSFILQWVPYRKVILEHGDRYANQSAKHGPIEVRPSQIQRQEQTPEEETSIDSGLSIELQAALEEFLQTLNWDFLDA